MKKYNKGLSLFVCLFVCCNLLQAQIYYLGVDELLDSGIRNSLSIKSSEVKSKMGHDKLSLAKNKRLPDIQVSGQFGFVGTPTILDTDLSFLKHSETPDWKQNYQFTAIQPLYEGGRIKANITKSEIEQEILDLTLEKNKSSLKLWLIAKYLDLYNLYKQRDAYDLSIKEAQKRLHNIQEMRSKGLLTGNDVLRSEIQLSNFQLSEKETLNNIVLTSQQLAIAMGMDENLIFQPDSTFLDSSENIQTMEDYIQEAYKNYPDMKIQNQNINLAKNNLKIVKADFLPALSLQFGNNFQRPIPNTSPTQDLYVNTWGITLNLSYKISSLFDKKYSLSYAKSQISLEEIAIEQQRQNIRTSVKTAYLKHKEALDRVEVLNNSLHLANENYRIEYTKYFNQLSILTDLLDANSVQLDARLKLTSAKVNVIYTYYQLLNISGKF